MLNKNTDQSKFKKEVSIIVPTLNEEGNVQMLIQIIDTVLFKGKIKYEIIFIDDHSIDKTIERIEAKTSDYPVRFYLKKGQKGKAYSLLEGFKHAKYSNICMIDADLQYPPQSIPEMLSLIEYDEADIVVADRKYVNVPFTRKLPSNGFKFIFGKVLHNLSCDVQSGLKVFRKEVINDLNLTPSPWTFDLEFLLGAKKKGFRIGSVNINFVKRYSGSAKINMLQATYEIGMSAIKLKFKRI